MFYKLALKNVRRSIRDYLLYFITLTFGVCVFYVFNSISSQSAMMKLSSTQSEILAMLSELVNIVSVFVSFVLAFLVLYTNAFLLRRRKKELGLYMTLGMPRRRVSLLLLSETALIGLLALGAGLLVSIPASLGMSSLLAGLFGTEMTGYIFQISTPALTKTLLYFGVIFLVSMLLNAFTLSRHRLLDLIHADRKNERLRFGRLWVSVILFLISIVMLVVAYRFIMMNGMRRMDFFFQASLVLGSVGTLLFFRSLAGFFLRIAQASKKLYLKNLNMFTLRQLNSRIGSTYMAMSFICIMLLIGIGALSTGFGFYGAIDSALSQFAAFDVSVLSMQGGEKDLSAALKTAGYDPDVHFSTYYQYELRDAGFDGFEWVTANGEALPADKSPLGYVASADVMALRDYNLLQAMQGKPALTLQDGQYLLCYAAKDGNGIIPKLLGQGASLTLGETTLTPASDMPLTEPLDLSGGAYYMTFIVGDEIADALPSTRSILNALFRDASERESMDKSSALMRSGVDNDLFVLTRADSVEAGLGMKMVMIFIGLYIGIVFLVSSAAVLAIQQLSQASDNQRRYTLLRKLGAPESMLSRTLFDQILIYFAAPLLLACVHSVVGIHVVNQTIEEMGKVDTAGTTLMTALVLLLTYGLYFVVTYFTARGITREKRT